MGLILESVRHLNDVWHFGFKLVKPNFVKKMVLVIGEKNIWVLCLFEKKKKNIVFLAKRKK